MTEAQIDDAITDALDMLRLYLETRPFYRGLAVETAIELAVHLYGLGIEVEGGKLPRTEEGDKAVLAMYEMAKELRDETN